MQTGIQQLRLRTPRRRLIIIFPSRSWRKAHQYTLRPAVRLQPEQRSPVMDQIEFYISPPADLLPFDLPLSISQIPPPLHDRQISPQETISACLLKCK